MKFHYQRIVCILESFEPNLLLEIFEKFGLGLDQKPNREKPSSESLLILRTETEKFGFFEEFRFFLEILDKFGLGSVSIRSETELGKTEFRVDTDSSSRVLKITTRRPLN